MCRLAYFNLRQIAMVKRPLYVLCAVFAAVGSSLVITVGGPIVNRWIAATSKGDPS